LFECGHVEAMDRDGRVLPAPDEIHELQIDEPDTLLVREIDDFFCPHDGSLLRIEESPWTMWSGRASPRRLETDSVRRSVVSGRLSLDGILAALAGANADGFLDGGDENCPVTDPAGLRALLDGVDDVEDHVIDDDDLGLHLGDE